MTTVRIVSAAVALLASAMALAQDVTPAAQPPAQPTAAAEAVAPPAAQAAQPAGKLSYTDDYRINVNHDADSDGEVVFRVTPKKKGTAKEIRVQVGKGTSENEIARAIKKAFVEQLGTKGYSIEMEDGENVIIEGSGGKTYSLVLVSTTVKGAKISVHRD